MGKFPLTDIEIPSYPSFCHINFHASLWNSSKESYAYLLTYYLIKPA